MRKILIGLALWIALVAQAHALYELTHSSCVGQANDKYLILNNFSYEGQACSTECPEIIEIRDNCFLDKMKGRSKVEVTTVRRICSRIACNPTFFQKMKY